MKSRQVCFGQPIEDWGPIRCRLLFGGIGLVVLLLLIFINWRVALLAAFSIPLALAVAAMTLKFMELNSTPWYCSQWCW
ncbi:MAG: hypothetical protein R3B38_02420 [Patescibacteria group bacterium]